MGKGDGRMPTELEKEVCKAYGLSPRRITDKQVLDIMEAILINYGTLELRDLAYQDSDGLYAEVPLDRKYVPDDYDEKPPVNAGYSATLKDTILSLMLCEQILGSWLTKDDIQYLLMTKFERLKETIWG